MLGLPTKERDFMLSSEPVRGSPTKQEVTDRRIKIQDKVRQRVNRLYRMMFPPPDVLSTVERSPRWLVDVAGSEPHPPGAPSFILFARSG